MKPVRWVVQAVKMSVTLSRILVALLFGLLGIPASGTEVSVPIPIVGGYALHARGIIKRPVVQIELPQNIRDTDIRTTGEGMLFAGTDSIVAIDAETGKIRWQTERGNTFRSASAFGSAASYDEDVEAGLAPRAGRMFASTALGGTIALESHTGREAWRSDAAFYAAVGLSALLSRNGRERTNVLRLSASNGAHVWEVTPQTGGLYAADFPVIIDDTLYASFTTDIYNGTWAFAWPTGRFLWVAAGSHIFYHNKKQVFMEATIPGQPDPFVFSTYFAFALLAVDRHSGVTRWTAKYAPDPTLNVTPHHRHPGLVYATAAHVDARWVWFKLFNIWYRYPLGALSGRQKAGRLVNVDIIAFSRNGSMLMRAADRVSYATPSGKTLVLHPLELHGKITFSQKLGSNAVVQAKGHLYEIDLAASRIKGTFDLPCTATRVLRIDQRLAVFCAPKNSERTKVIEYLN